MRMLSKKNKGKNIIKKSIIYVVFCYLVASWGVNGVINPIHYYRNFALQEKTIEGFLEDKGIRVEWVKEDSSKFSYISFEVMDVKNFYDDILVNTYSDGELLCSETMGLYKGLNSFKIQENSTSIRISSEMIEKNQLVISDFVLSEYLKVDIGKMLEIIFSMLFLIIVWESVQYIKNRYTK